MYLILYRKFGTSTFPDYKLCIGKQTMNQTIETTNRTTNLLRYVYLMFTSAHWEQHFVKVYVWIVFVIFELNVLEKGNAA